MIIRRRDALLVIVSQVDHQAQCGVLARAWGNATFTRPGEFDDLIHAAEIHDEGWREWEEHPCIDSGGHPVDFPDLPRADHIPLYRRGIRRAVANGPGVGLLVSMHGQGLYEKRLGLDGPTIPRSDRPVEEREFLAEQDALQERLIARLGDLQAHAWAWAGFRLLQAWDSLSLYLTWRGRASGATWILPRVPRRVGDDGIDLKVSPGGTDGCVVDPWPFATDTVRAPVATREIPDRVYADDGDLRRVLSDAPTRTQVFTLRPDA